MANAQVKPAKENISFDDFAKLDIRAGKIIAAEKVAKTKKLMKLTIDTGIDTRTVVSGIAEYYTPEEVDLIHAGAANAPAVPNTDVPIQAGDLKYKDLNGDGVINDFDKGAIGKPNLPNTTLGWTIGGSWKGLSVSVLFQGSFNYSFSVNGTGIEPFKSQFQPLHQKRWTLERYLNGEAIEFPRLTSNPSTVNSAAAYMSDFWLIDAWYIRLKTIDVSYQVPTKVLPSWLTNLRVYLNAYNMFTWTSFDKYQQDPEIKSNSAGDAYMNQRVFNLGVQLTF